MSYPEGSQPRRTAPLIARPRSNQPAQSHPSPTQPPQSHLGQAIAGALGGMGMGWPPMGYGGWNPMMGMSGMVMQGSGPPQPGVGPPPPRMQHGLPSYNGGTHYGPPQQQDPNYGYGPYAQRQQQHQAYPPFYPPPLFAQHQPPSYSSHPPPPRTTAEGYTLSEAYVPPPPSADPTPRRESRPLPRRPPGARTGGGDAGPNSRRDNNGPAAGPGGTGGSSGGAHKCSKIDCKFEGNRKMVREHEEDRHLIYAPGKEPKPWVPTYKAPAGVRIEGTNISLDSPEAIAKWIEDRKKKWPSAQVVEEREKQRAERIAAGLEAPPRSGRGGRGSRGRGERGGSRGRGRGRGGMTFSDADGNRDAKRVKVEHSAPEGNSSSSSSSASDSGSDSDSSDEDTDDDDGPPVASSSKISDPALFVVGDGAGDAQPGNEGGRGPRIHPSRLAVDGVLDSVKVEGGVSEMPTAEKQFQVVCKHWRQGNCALGEKCPYLHILPLRSTHLPLPPKRKRPAPPPPLHNPFARADPFAQLAERDISHVISDVLYAVDFLAKNDWLRGVELKAGQIDEAGGIEEVESIPSESIVLKSEINLVAEMRESALEEVDGSVDGEQGEEGTGTAHEEGGELQESLNLGVVIGSGEL